MSDYMKEMCSGYEDNGVLATGSMGYIGSHIEAFFQRVTIRVTIKQLFYGNCGYESVN